MSDFFPGDKVRFLNEDGEGIVVAVQGNGVMVRTADGFDIPYPAAQLVKFESGNPRFEREKEEDAAIDELRSEHGIFLSYQKKSTDLCKVFLVNQTTYPLYFSLCEQVGNRWKGRLDGMLPSGAFAEVASRFMSQLERWPIVSVRILYLGDDKELPEPKSFEHKVVAKKFLSTLATTPVMNKEGYLFQLDGDEWREQQVELKSKLKQIFKNAGAAEQVLDETSLRIPDVIDLHIEAIPTAPPNLSTKSILRFQLNYADEMLDKAVAAGKAKITFIHGAGDGVLKREIQEMARKNPHVTSFGKADPSKYGGGATFLKLE
ncbi:hypothetical protein GC194_02965 [bacterium]|nr:hypothetical protein [bacterium]